MTDSKPNPSIHDLAPPEPMDPQGTRPALNLEVVIGQVKHIQEKLAAERAAKAEKEKGEKPR